MDPKSIVLYLDRKGWAALDIHDGLVSTLGDESIAYNTVTKHLGEAQILPPMRHHYCTQLHVTLTNQMTRSRKLLKKPHRLQAAI
jgi:hypothetical protein